MGHLEEIPDKLNGSPIEREPVEVRRIEMFGGLCAVGEGRTIYHFRTQRGGLLLCCLALNRGRALSRDYLCEMLWPGDDTTAQRGRLRYELSVLRSLLGSRALVREGNSLVSLASDIETDVAEFVTLAAQVTRSSDPRERFAPLKQALQLYRSGLLPGVVPPEDEYATDDWVNQERLRLADLHYDLITRMILDCDAAGNTQEAGYYRRIAASQHPDRPLPLAPPVNLPARYSSPVESAEDGLFGRDTERVLLKTWWEESEPENRVLTLTGLGGIGKTYLVRTVFRGDPHILVPLEEVENVDEVWSALLRGLGLPADTRRLPRRRVLEELGARGHFLVILDGAEGLLRPVATVLRELLAACPQLRVLITSRRPLKLTGERVEEIRPLPVRVAAEMFLCLARRYRPDFAATPQAEALAGEIATLLEGIPLALELAAARAVVLGPRQILEQLGRQLRFLTSVRPRKDKRHQSMRAALEWSVSLLPQRTRLALSALAVFRGPFRYAAAEAVLGKESDTLDVLEELHMYGLIEVTFDPYDEAAQYRLLAPVSEFAREMLTPDLRQEAALRHLAFYEGEAGEILELVRSEKWDEGSRRLLRDLPNFRGAALFSVEENDSQRLLRLLECLGLPYMELGLWGDFETLIRSTESLLDTLPPSPALASILGWRAAHARRRGDNERARRYFQRRLKVCEAIRDVPGQISTWFEFAGQAVDEGDVRGADGALRRGRALYQMVEDASFLTNDSVLTARVAVIAGQPAAAYSATQNALNYLRASGKSGQAVVYAYTYLATVLLDIAQNPQAGEHYQSSRLLAEAEAMLAEAMMICEQQARWFGLGVLLYEWHRLLVLRGDREAALTALTRAIALHEDLETRYVRRYRRALDMLTMSE